MVANRISMDWTVPTFGERASDVPDGGPAPWDRINVDRAAWSSNPFVWVYDFSRAA